MIVPVFSRERPLRARLSGDRVLLRRQALPQFVFADLPMTDAARIGAAGFSLGRGIGGEFGMNDGWAEVATFGLAAPFEIFLVIFFRGIKFFRRDDLRDDFSAQHARFIHFVDGRLGYPLLFRVMEKYRGAILRS